MLSSLNILFGTVIQKEKTYNSKEIGNELSKQEKEIAKDGWK